MKKFISKLMVLAVALTGAAGAMVGAASAQGAITCDVTLDPVDSINDAISNDLPAGGGTVCLNAGTYDEEVVISKDNITLTGDPTDSRDNNIIISPNTAANSSVGENGAIEVTSNDVTIQNLTIQNNISNSYYAGIAIPSDISNLTVDNVVIDGSSVVSGNPQHGIATDNEASVNGLTITNSLFSNLSTGLYFYDKKNDSEPASSYITDLLVSDSSFINNTNKGIYIEKIGPVGDTAIFRNLTVTGNGLHDYSAANPNPHFTSGIDINLTHDEYGSILLENITATGNGLNNGEGGAGTAGIMIRDYGDILESHSSTMQDITITNSTVTGNERGVVIGNSDSANDSILGDVTINNSNIYDNEVIFDGMPDGHNVSEYAIEEDPFTAGELVSNMADGVAVDATSNWWGTTNPATIAESIYDAGTTVDVDYVPFLCSLGGSPSNDSGSCHSSFGGTEDDNASITGAASDGNHGVVTKNEDGTYDVEYQSTKGIPATGNSEQQYQIIIDLPSKNVDKSIHGLDLFEIDTDVSNVDVITGDFDSVRDESGFTTLSPSSIVADVDDDRLVIFLDENASIDTEGWVKIRNIPVISEPDSITLAGQYGWHITHRKPVSETTVLDSDGLGGLEHETGIALLEHGNTTFIQAIVDEAIILIVKAIYAVLEVNPSSNPIATAITPLEVYSNAYDGFVIKAELEDAAGTADQLLGKNHGAALTAPADAETGMNYVQWKSDNATGTLGDDGTLSDTNLPFNGENVVYESAGEGESLTQGDTLDVTYEVGVDYTTPADTYEGNVTYTIYPTF